MQSPPPSLRAPNPTGHSPVLRQKAWHQSDISLRSLGTTQPPHHLPRYLPSISFVPSSCSIARTDKAAEAPVFDHLQVSPPSAVETSFSASPPKARPPCSEGRRFVVFHHPCCLVLSTHDAVSFPTGSRHSRSTSANNPPLVASSRLDNLPSEPTKAWVIHSRPTEPCSRQRQPLTDHFLPKLHHEWTIQRAWRAPELRVPA